MRPLRLAPHALGLLLAAPLLAQDSVSKLQALPGDALDPRDAFEQRNDYVVDLSALESSWGNAYMLGPLVKGSLQRRQAPDFYTALISAQAISRDELADVPFARPSYLHWNEPGRGVNGDPAKNDPGTPLDTSTSRGRRFAVGFAEFALGDFDSSLNNVIGAVVDRDPARPSRLFVSRVVAAVNSPGEACNLGEIGFGTIDADGALHFRADDSQGQVQDCGEIPAVAGNNYVRVRTAARDATLVNVLRAGGGTDAGATDLLLAGAALVHNTPSAIPTSVAGRPLALGSNFGTQFVHEAVPGVLSATSTHMASPAVDHRGNVSWSPHAFPHLLGAGTHGTAAMLGVDVLQPTNTLLVWGLAADGTPSGARALRLPTPLTNPNYIEDRDDGFRSNALGLGFVAFDHYHSQVAFRGGNGQVAVGRDLPGNLLVAAVANIPNVATPTTDDNVIAVGRLDATGALEWTIAAWVVNDFVVAGGGVFLDQGKAIFDASGAAVGRLTGAGNLSLNAGPSFSSPMIDAAGNVWFLGTIEVAGQVTVGLLRAVLDPARFAYRLELVLRQGQVLRGRNSRRDYQIAFLDLFDSNSVSSGTAFSGNVTGGAWDGLDPSTLAPGDPRALGGLVIKATIVYDLDQDGQFVRSTGTSGTPGSPDEDYQVLLYVAPTVDCDRDGVPDDAQIAEGAGPDEDADGVLDTCQAAVGFCFGDGSALPCPGAGSVPSCADGAPGHGCANSGDPAGARLRAFGDPATGSLSLFLGGLPPAGASPVVLLRGTQTMAPSPFGDGLRCVLPSGGFQLGGVGSNGGTRLSIAQPGSGTFYYQAWYRNALSTCSGQRFNLSNGIRVVWP